MKKKYLYHIAVSCLFIGFIITRFFRVTTIPSGFHVDEAGMAYDAWSLAHYGYDRHLNSWPMYLINFGGGQSIMYAYLCAGLFKLFGYHPLLIRLPSIVFSFLTLLFGMLIAKKVYPQNKYLPLLTGLLLTICPYFIMAGRFGFDCNLMLGMSTVFLYCFIQATDKQEYKWYVLSGITGGLVLYTYVLSYLVLPVFLIISLIYVIYHHKFDFKKWLCMGVFLGVLAFPLIWVQVVNMFDLPEMYMGIFTITKLPKYRVSELGHFSFGNFVRALQSTFIGDTLDFNSIPGFPNLYYVSIGLFVIGILSILSTLRKTLKTKSFFLSFFPFFWFCAMLIIESSLESNTSKINGIFYATIFIVVEGFITIFVMLRKYARYVIGALIVVYCIGFLRFSTYYYLGQYTVEHYPHELFFVTVTEAIHFLEENPQYQGKGTYMAEPGILFALSTLAAPNELLTFEAVSTYYDYYHCSHLGEIEDGYNYIVTDIYTEYADELRKRGYTEIKFTNYSLFYQE
ncbi:MAG: glycosyltransferase family 39 protein [Lachnospiraceae bacterium]|nr:glycosyltransferase family 39 protein [Lachnospiraceae bacterium]